MTSSPSYLVIGAGVFGASTAYHLSKTHPSSSITLVDRTPFPCPLGASHDLNKVVRADYNTPFYLRLALEALKKWNNDPLWKPYFHRTGMSILGGDTTDEGHPLYTRTIIQNYEEEARKGEAGMLPDGHGCQMLSFEEFRKKFDPTGEIFHDMYSEPVVEVFHNPDSGWGDAELALKATIEAAVSQGVKYVQGRASKLLFDDSSSEDGKKKCIGVQIYSGEVLKADHIILSTAAGTGKLLYNSLPHTPAFQAEKRILAAGVICYVVRLTPEQLEKYKDLPVVVYEVHGVDVHGEMMAPTKEGYMKFNWAKSFLNTDGEAEISAPPDREDQGQWEVSESMKLEARKMMWGVLGKGMEGLDIQTWRICWDSITPNQDFIISHHPYSPNLSIATGGSFHGWKFLPIIGEYVDKLIHGTLEDDLVKRWAWDRENEGAAHAGLIPVRELRDL